MFYFLMKSLPISQQVALYFIDILFIPVKALEDQVGESGKSDSHVVGG